MNRVVDDAVPFVLQDFGEVRSNGQADAVAWRSGLDGPERAERPEAIEGCMREVNGRFVAPLLVYFASLCSGVEGQASERPTYESLA